MEQLHAPRCQLGTPPCNAADCSHRLGQGEQGTGHGLGMSRQIQGVILQAPCELTSSNSHHMPLQEVCQDGGWTAG